MLQSNNLSALDASAVILTFKVSERKQREFAFGCAAVNFIERRMHIWRHSKVNVSWNDVFERLGVVKYRLLVALPDGITFCNMDVQVSLDVPESHNVSIGDLLPDRAILVSRLYVVANGLRALLYQLKKVALFIKLSDRFGSFEQPTTIKVDQLNLLTILDLFPDAPL